MPQGKSSKASLEEEVVPASSKICHNDLLADNFSSKKAKVKEVGLLLQRIANLVDKEIRNRGNYYDFKLDSPAKIVHTKTQQGKR